MSDYVLEGTGWNAHTIHTIRLFYRSDYVMSVLDRIAPDLTLRVKLLMDIPSLLDMFSTQRRI